MSTRYRSRGGFTPGTNLDIDSVKWLSDCTGNWVVNSTTLNDTMVGDFESMSDVVIPHYHKLVKSGKVFFSPMTKRVVRSLPSVGSGRHVQRKNPTISCSGTDQRLEHKNTQFTAPLCLSAAGYSGSLVGMPVPVGAVFSAQEIAAMQSEVSTRVMAQRGLEETNLFESVAEINKLASMVTGPLMGLKNFLKQKTPKALVMGAAAAWLTYRYGMRPFVNDIEGILKGLKKTTGKKRKTTRAFLSQERTSIQTLPSLDYGGWSSNIQITTIDNVLLRAMVLDEYDATVHSNIGFTGKGLVGLAWELIPFSFVADWFWNVGDFLYAYIPAFGYEQLGSCMTTTRLRSTTYVALDAHELPGSIWNLIEAPTGTLSGSVWEKTRSPLSDPKMLTKADFRFHQVNRMADAVALLVVVSDMAARIFGGAPAGNPRSSGSNTKFVRR